MEQYVYTYDSFAQRGAEQYVPTERFQVKSSVYLPASDIDLRTGRLQPDRQRRRRTQALMLEKSGWMRRIRPSASLSAGNTAKAVYAFPYGRWY